VVLLHGLGADGRDLIALGESWQALLPHAEFVAPNAPFPCDMAPYGYQWFSLQDRAPARILAGVQATAPLLQRFLDEALAARGLTPDRMALVGFSQGTMMSLFVAPRRPLPVAGVVGYSGALFGGERLAVEATARPPVLLVHGDADPVVPVEALPAAVAALKAGGFAVEWARRPGLGHGIDAEGLHLGGQFLSRVLAAPN
jgi:phospholipase/carboxylesterase